MVPILVLVFFLALHFPFIMSVVSKVSSQEVSDGDTLRMSISTFDTNESVDGKSLTVIAGVDNAHRLYGKQSPRGKLRYDWTNMALTSPMGKRIEALMNNCSLPLGHAEMLNVNGLGAELHIWSQKLCNAMDQQWRIRTSPPWQWLDEEVCGHDMVSTMKCRNEMSWR